MTAHDLSGEGVAERLAPVVGQALAAFGIDPGSPARLVNVSENATYLVDDAATGERSVLRVHRQGYHDRTAIESELAWLDAVRSEAGVRTPRVLPAPGGDRVLALGDVPRHVVRFEFLTGAEPQPGDADLPDWFVLLGAVTARLHRHAREWAPPVAFRRFAWDLDAAFGPDPRWGRWADGIAVGPSEHALLARLEAVLRRRLRAFGTGPDRYGLVHADLRLANLLVDGDETRVIDFDDCGTGWFLYDFGAAVSFFEDDPRLDELIGAWVRGYRTVGDLSAADVAEIPTFVMMRRLLLLAWIGSHSGTDLARSSGAEFTATSCQLAEQFLSRHS